jgi:hypothetical protein
MTRHTKPWKDDMRNPADVATLAALQDDFPLFRIWLEPTYTQIRFVACRRNLGPGLHTVITKDPAELRATLAAAGAPDPAADAPPSLPQRVPHQRQP